jgi:hypothetical protein
MRFSLGAAHPLRGARTMKLIEINAYHYGECIGHGTYCEPCAEQVREMNDHLELEEDAPESECCKRCGRKG